MKLKKFFKLITVLAFSSAIIGIWYFFKLPPHLAQNTPAKTVIDNEFGWKFPVAKFPEAGSPTQIAYSNIRDPGGIPKGLPVRLQIPVINVSSAIEDAQITPDGRMDVPAGSVNVAWFSLGPHPGQVGSAVIGGHFGIDNGVPKVFYNLNKVKIGDKVYVVDDKGETLAFAVRRIQSFDRNADATTVFTSGDGIAHLNLITCEGTWNQSNGTYPLRLVLFTDAIPSEGVVAIPKPAAAVKLPQTAKTQAKTTPTPIPSETPTLSPISTPVEVIDVSDTNQVISTPQLLVTFIKSLFVTPLDKIVTTFLFLTIIFIAFKIIRR